MFLFLSAKRYVSIFSGLKITSNLPLLPQCSAASRFDNIALISVKVNKCNYSNMQVRICFAIRISGGYGLSSNKKKNLQNDKIIEITLLRETPY